MRRNSFLAALSFNLGTLQILQQLAGFEKALVSTQLSIFGRLYYTDTLRNIYPNKRLSLWVIGTLSWEFGVGPATN